ETSSAAPVALQKKLAHFSRRALNFDHCYEFDTVVRNEHQVRERRCNSRTSRPVTDMGRLARRVRESHCRHSGIVPRQRARGRAVLGLAVAGAYAARTT